MTENALDGTGAQNSGGDLGAITGTPDASTTMPTAWDLDTDWAGIFTQTSADADGHLFDVNVTLEGEKATVPGWYEDTITFTISDV